MKLAEKIVVILALLLLTTASHAIDLRFYSIVYGPPEAFNPIFGIDLECRNADGSSVSFSSGTQLRAPLRGEVVFRDIPLGTRCRYQHIVPQPPAPGSGRGAQFRPAAGQWTDLIVEPTYSGSSELSVQVTQQYYKTQDYGVYGSITSVLESLPEI
jgi:hypothetical protein